MDIDRNRPEHWSTWDGSDVICQHCGVTRRSTLLGQAWATAVSHAADHGDPLRCRWCETPAEFFVGGVHGMYTGVADRWPRPAAHVSRFTGSQHWTHDPVCQECLEAGETVVVLRPTTSVR